MMAKSNTKYLNYSHPIINRYAYILNNNRIKIMESKKIPIKSNTLELPQTEEVKLDAGQTGNPQKKKPQLRRSTAVNYEDDEEALKQLKKSQ